MPSTLARESQSSKSRPQYGFRSACSMATRAANRIERLGSARSGISLSTGIATAGCCISPSQACRRTNGSESESLHQSRACPVRRVLAEQPHGPDANYLVVIRGQFDQQGLAGSGPELGQELESANPVLRSP